MPSLCLAHIRKESDSTALLLSQTEIADSNVSVRRTARRANPAQRSMDGPRPLVAGHGRPCVRWSGIGWACSAPSVRSGCVRQQRNDTVQGTTPTQPRIDPIAKRSDVMRGYRSLPGKFRCPCSNCRPCGQHFGAGAPSAPKVCLANFGPRPCTPTFPRAVAPPPLTQRGLLSDNPRCKFAFCYFCLRKQKRGAVAFLPNVCEAQPWTGASLARGQ